MDFIELANRRYSVRAYSSSPVPREKIELCLEAARLAPSACNSQPWRLIVVDDPELKNAVARETFGRLISFNHFSIKAPVLVVTVSEKPNITSKFGAAVKNRPFHLIDIGMAVEHLCLQAAELGLGTCILGWFDEKAVKKLLNIPDRKRVDLIVCMGYPETEKIRPKVRKDLSEIVSYNKYL